MGKKFGKFHLGYVLKFNKDNGALLDNITATTVELEEKEAAVAVRNERVKEVSAVIVASDTVDDKDSNQLEIANTQLRANKEETATVSRTLLRYKTEWSDKESGKYDRYHINWERSIAKKERIEEWNYNFVWDNIGARLELIDEWDVVTSGSKRHGMAYAQAILQICVSLFEFRSLS